MLKDEKGTVENAGCAVDTVDGIATRLRSVLDDAPESAVRIFASHHPLRSAGRHAHHPSCPKDWPCPNLKQTREMIEEALAERPPTLCIAGHDHNLQLLRGGTPCRYFAVSGGASDLRPLEKSDDSIVALQRNGLVQLDRLRNGQIQFRLYFVSDETSISAKDDTLAITLD